MNAADMKPIRRIVTGEDANGRSRIVEDGPSPAVRLVAESPGFRNTNIWATHGSPTPIGAPDRIKDHQGVTPPSMGTVVRIIDIPPEIADPEERKRQTAAVFGQLFRDAGHVANSPRHAGMHKTDTIDYAILMEGELTAIMDEDETVMHAGDVLIQRGTNHAWANRSGKPCRIAFILIDAKR